MLAYRSNKALVRADEADHKVYICIDGPQSMRRTFLALIRDNFDYIHGTITGIEAREMLPLPDHPDAPPVSYLHLLNLERARVPSYIPEGLIEPVNVKELLDLEEEEEARQERRAERMERQRTKPPPEREEPRTPSAPTVPPAAKDVAASPAMMFGLGILGILAAFVVFALVVQTVPHIGLLGWLIAIVMLITLLASFGLVLYGAMKGETFGEIITKVLDWLKPIRDLFSGSPPQAR